MQIAVKINLPIKRAKRYPNSCWPVITDIKTSVPKPKTSLKIIPHIPQENPAITGACQLFILILAGIVPRKITSFIKRIATIAANGPIITKLIMISLISKGIAVSKEEDLIPISVAEKLAP